MEISAKNSETEKPSKFDPNFLIDEDGDEYWLFTDYDGTIKRMTLPYDLEVYQ